MNCIDCQENLSAFLDGELDHVSSSNIQTHLTLCIECAKVCEDLTEILLTCDETHIDEIAPPNADALWCRINNIIEADLKTEEPVLPPVPEIKPNRLFQFSFSQVGSAVLGIAIISSLLTIVGIRNYFEPSGNDYTTRSSESQTTFEKLMSKVGLADTPQEARERRINEQNAAISYWNQRVQTRRVNWDKRMRDAFDRNLMEIDQTVSEYTVILDKDPQDELSGEMLDAALNDKMNLLRQFSEL